MEIKMLRDDTPRLRRFFSSNRVESATHRHYWKMQDRAQHTRRRCRTAPLENFPFVWITGSVWMRWKRREKKRQEEQGNGEEERKKESSVHVHWCTLRDLGNGKWERGEEIMISKRYRVPYVPKDYYPLNLGLISEKREKKNAMIRIIAMIDDVWLAVEQRRFRNTWEAN